MARHASRVAARSSADLVPGGEMPGRATRRATAAPRTRRNRVLLAVATVASVAIVAAWFPVSSLLHQRAQLAAASAALSRVDHQNQALQRDAKQLQTPGALSRIAQQQYGLVSPGEQAYQVLPPSGTPHAGGPLATGPTPPAGGAGQSGVRVSTSRTSSGARGSSPISGHRRDHAATGTSGSFFTRVLQTLEFWR